MAARQISDDKPSNHWPGYVTFVLFSFTPRRRAGGTPIVGPGRPTRVMQTVYYMFHVKQHETCNRAQQADVTWETGRPTPAEPAWRWGRLCHRRFPAAEAGPEGKRSCQYQVSGSAHR